MSSSNPPDISNQNNAFRSPPGTGMPHGDSGQSAGEWNPYQATWTETRTIHYQSQTGSALSVLSMISGVLSIPLICLCFLSVPFSLFAIVSGHISRSIIRRSQGRLTGDGMAVTGMVLGYLSFFITASMIVLWSIAANSTPTFIPPGPAPPQMVNSKATNELDEAIAMLSLSLSVGKSPESDELARHLHASLLDLTEQLAKEARAESERPNTTAIQQPAESENIAELPDTLAPAALQNSLVSSRVYCALQSDSCAFLVQVSNLDELSESDKLQLSKFIWLASGRTLDGHRDEGCELAVGLVSNGQLDEVSMGHFERSDYFDAGLQYRGAADDSEIRSAFAGHFSTSSSTSALPEAAPELSP